MCLRSPPPPPMAQTIAQPTISAADVNVGAREAEQRARERRLRAGVTQTIFTGDRGVSSAPGLYTKQLLGA